MYELKKKKNGSVDLDDLAFYFDAQAKDRYDQGTLGRRTGQVLALREKLLSLPEGDFDMAIRTIEKLVADVPKRSPTLDPKGRADINKQARTLYEKVEAAGQGSAAASTEKIHKI